MKKGKGLLWFTIGSAVTTFVLKNKWCQEKIVQPIGKKLNSFVEKCKDKCQEAQEAAEQK